MKYEIKPVSEAQAFKPFTVTFTINTHEEYVAFHDKLAIKIADSGPFVGDVYRNGNDMQEGGEGTFTFKN